MVSWFCDFLFIEIYCTPTNWIDRHTSVHGLFSSFHVSHVSHVLASLTTTFRVKGVVLLSTMKIELGIFIAFLGRLIFLNICRFIFQKYKFYRSFTWEHLSKETLRNWMSELRIYECRKNEEKLTKIRQKIENRQYYPHCYIYKGYLCDSCILLFY